MKRTKTKKINNRIKEVPKEKLFKLYNNLPYICQSCVNNALCPEIKDMDDIKDCKNYDRAIELNEIIKMLNEQNVNLSRFCDDYGLKKEFLKEMLYGKMFMKYRYYVAICKRCHVKGYDEFSKYEKRFELENEEVISLK